MGQTFGASLVLANNSTPPESTTYPVLTFGEILVVPACSSFPFDDCSGGAEPDAFTLAPVGMATGAQPASCLGTWVISEMAPGRYRFTPPGGEGSLQLATGESCTVVFTAGATRLPQADMARSRRASKPPKYRSTPSARRA